VDNLVNRSAGGRRVAASGRGATVAPIAPFASATAVAALAALGHLDPQRLTTEVAAVELFDHGIGEGGIIEVDEAETATGAGLAVKHGLEAHTGSDGGEQAFKLLLVE
jgi:hypothetical protein